MPIITLTTDFGMKDHFVGTVKGAIYSEISADVRIVDISHDISPFNITETAYVVKNAYKSFPDKTIHIIGVDSELSIENKHIVLELDNQYFICPDNGVISMIASEIQPYKVYEITIHDLVASSFPVLDVFVKVASHIARGGNLNIIGKEINHFKKLTEIQPKVNQNQTIIKGEVIYVDNYGNVITNISKKLFNDIGKQRSFTILARSYEFYKIHTKYNEIVDYNSPLENRQNDGKRLAIFNSSNFLEIAIYRSNPKTHGGASSLLGLHYRDTVSIQFEEVHSNSFNIIS